MTKRRLPNYFPSLQSQMLAMLLVAAVLALLVGFGGDELMERGIARWYLDPAAMEHRANVAVGNLIAYVDENDVAGTDLSALKSWADTQRDVSLVIDLPDAAYEVTWWGVAEAERSWISEIGEYGYFPYTIAFSDGDYPLWISESSEIHLYEITTYASIVLAAAILVAALLIYARRVTARIGVLTADVNAISGGDLEHPIYPTSRDELSRLARDVDRMRTRIIEQARSEQNALQANSDLITALSHDIRNPLTSLIGYMELLEMEQDTLPQEAQEYVRASLDKAYRIRDLTGELFRYFLVFGKPEETVELDDYDAQILLEQLLGESIVDLHSRGFLTKSHALERPCTVRTDVQMLKRVMDNLLSNLLKYADPSSPILFHAEEDGMLIVRIENRIRSDRGGAVESNHIGLRTCEAIMQLLGGAFTAAAEGNRFTVQCCLPLGERKGD